ncbi:MAG: SIMPL domain-containing protein [Candidatus Paceibacterota bacterium]|jgi:hypothetical protein
MTNNEKIKIGVWIAKGVAMILVAVAAFIYAGSYADSIANMSPSINVSGIGKVVAKPDVARFTLTIQTEGGKDIAALRKINDDSSNKIVDFLKKSGVPKEDIKTTNYSMTPRYQNFSCRNVPVPQMVETNTMMASAPYIGTQVCPPSEVVGYTFNNTIEVTVRDFEKKDVTGLLAGVVKNGATRVSQLRFELDDPSVARSLAKAEAIKKAQAEAKRLAKESGISLGRILSIDESGSPMYYSTKSSLGMGGEVSAVDTAPAIEAGSQDISVTVNVRYALK